MKREKIIKKETKKVILTIAIISALLLTGLSAVSATKATTVQKRSVTAKITEETIKVEKLVEGRNQGHWFFCADVDSTGYATLAVLRCYDGIISVTYSDGVTTINAPLRTKTFMGPHTIDIYGFGGTTSWGGSVTNRDISFTGLGIACFIKPL